MKNLKWLIVAAVIVPVMVVMSACGGNKAQPISLDETSAFLANANDDAISNGFKSTMKMEMKIGGETIMSENNSYTYSNDKWLVIEGSDMYYFDGETTYVYQKNDDDVTKFKTTETYNGIDTEYVKSQGLEGESGAISDNEDFASAIQSVTKQTKNGKTILTFNLDFNYLMDAITAAEDEDGSGFDLSSIFDGATGSAKMIMTFDSNNNLVKMEMSVSLSIQAKIDEDVFSVSVSMLMTIEQFSGNIQLPSEFDGMADWDVSSLY